MSDVQNTFRCPQCDLLVSAGQRFCPHCGEKLPEQAAPSPQQSPAGRPYAEAPQEINISGQKTSVPSTDFSQPSYPSSRQGGAPSQGGQRAAANGGNQPQGSELPPVSFAAAVLEGLQNYKNFDGRARRSAFWKFTLFLFICYTVAPIAFSSLFGTHGMPWLISLAVDVTLIVPLLSSLTRRLHDGGHSGWHVAIASPLLASSPILIFVGIVNLLYGMAGSGIEAGYQDTFFGILKFLLILVVYLVIIFVWSVKDGERGTNKYGKSPKYK